jgi:glucosamine-6-phosphate deaminase
MKIIKCNTYEEMSEKAGAIFTNHINKKPNICLGLATGSTPIGLYKELIKAYKHQLVSFSEVISFNLDEYVGIDQNHPESYYQYMMKNLFNQVDMNEENIHLPKNDLNNLDENVDSYNKALKKHKIDLQILGIGQNGHIGFNEPGTSFEQETFVVTLDENTRIANQRFFNSIDEVPKQAITMGIKNIMHSKEIVLMASGKNKAQAIKNMIYGPVTNTCPASILQLHPHVTVLVDQEAGALI